MTGRAPALSRSLVDRAAHRRVDDAWLQAAWADPASRVLVVDEGRAAVDETDAGPRLHYISPADAPAGDHFFLGESGGTAYWAVAGAPLPAGTRTLGLREVGAALADRDAGLLVHAVALANWHASHRHCPRCGSPTRPEQAGAIRVCPADGSEHYPRTDPAVIMLVHDDADRCVLGRQPSWPPGRYSTLAGFVEPGESAEQAVAREVVEEVGIGVTDLTYVASQPWPFPASLMLGFTAVATSETLHVDDGELAAAQWFSRADLRSGGVKLPPPVSIAYRLISGWAGTTVPTGW